MERDTEAESTHKSTSERSEPIGTLHGEPDGSQQSLDGSAGKLRFPLPIGPAAQGDERLLEHCVDVKRLGHLDHYEPARSENPILFAEQFRGIRKVFEESLVKYAVETGITERKY